MLTISDKWKEEIVKDSRICRSYAEIESNTIEDTDKLIDWTIYDTIYDNDFIGSFVKRKLTLNMFNSNKSIIYDNKRIKVYAGLEYIDESEDEYLNMGTFIIYNAPYDDVNKTNNIEAYDISILFDVPYANISTYPCTYRQYLQDICDNCNVELSSDVFNLEDTVLAEEPHVDEGATFRDAIKQLIKVCMSNAKMINDELTVISVKREYTDPDFEFSDYFELVTYDKKGPYNVLVLGRNPQQDNIYYPEELPETILEYRIDNNQIVDAYREVYAPIMFPFISDLEFVPFEMELLKGRPELMCLDYISFTDLNETEYSSIIFTHELKFTGDFKSKIKCDVPSDTETNYQRAGSITTTLSNTEIRVDKQENEISLVVQRIDGVDESITSIEQDVDSVEVEVQKITGLEEQTNTLETTVEGISQTLLYKGGYNLIFNSVKQFGNDGYTGTFPTYQDTDTINNLMSKSAILFKEGTDGITFSVPNGQYNYSIIYKKLITLAECKITVNGVEIELTEEDWISHDISFNVTDNTITIAYESDTDDACLVGDILLILGESKQVWTPNPNEIYTDTVKISRGIEVSSNTSNTKLLADTDGTRVVNKSTDEVVAEFTDKGTVTEELTATKGQIASLLIINMGTQTWLNRL